MAVERIEDVVSTPEVWQPPNDGVRIDFDSWGLLEQQRIPHSMGADDEENYFTVIEQVAEELGSEVRVRAAPSMVGPAAGDGTPTFIDIFHVAKDWGAIALFVVAAVKKLRSLGVKDIRVSERGIEELARHALRSRGMEHARLVDVKLIPGPQSPLVGGPPNYLGYIASFAADDGRVVCLRFSLDGLFEAWLDEATSEGE